MCVYLRTKFQVSSTILTSFRLGGGGGVILPPSPQNEPLKSPPRLELNEKKINFSHDSKIAVQVFNTLSCKFPQMITKLTEDTELAFTERLESLYLIIILLIKLLSHILNESNSNFVAEFL